MTATGPHSLGCMVFVIAALGCSDGRSCHRSGHETVPSGEAIPGQAIPGERADSGDGVPERSLTLWLGGDVHLGANRDDGLAPLAQELVGAFGIVNLEGPVGSDAAASTAERLVNAPESLEMLAAHGVVVAGIANNHAGDLGARGIAATKQALTARGIAPAGHPAGDGVAVIEHNGIRVAVSAHDLSAGVPDDLAAQLGRARKRGDVLVAWFHVLAPPLYNRRPELRQAVDLALAAGATVIAGHGSHAIARVERRGDAVIVWGLGNLLFACECSRETEGLIVYLELSRNGVGKAEVIPIDAGLSGAPATLAAEPGVTLDLLESLGSRLLRRTGDRGFF